MLLALAVALPFVLLTAGIMWQLANNERETRREAILFSTRTLMNAVDTVLSKQIAVAQMLATSPALAADDLPAFREEAARAMSGLSGGWIVLADEGGQQLINLAPGATEPLPRRVEAAMKIQRRALETGQVQISGIYNGAVQSQRWRWSCRCFARKSRPSKSSSAWSLACSCRCSSNGTCRRAGLPAWSIATATSSRARAAMHRWSASLPPKVSARQRGRPPRAGTK